MKNHVRILFATLALSTLNPQLSTALAQGTAFTYQGQLQSNGGPANGTFNLQFSLYTNSTDSTAVAGPVTNSAVVITNGLFTVIIDFGASVWNGPTNWLQIGVATNGGSNFTTLAPRQELTPVPYAIYAESANLAGTYAGSVNFDNGANTFDGSFYGAFYGVSFIGGNFTGNFIGTGIGLTDVWHTDGNSGTTAGQDFVGTTDNQPLELHVNNQRVLRLVPDTTTNNSPDIIGGSPVNIVSPGLVGVTISGGGAGIYGGRPATNQALGDFNTIGGGYGNATGSTNFDVTEATIAGGAFNTASGITSFIGGGAANVADNNNATVAGGLQNRANFHAFVGGGFGNTADGIEAVIGGGHQNNIQTNTVLSVIGGGYLNTIQGNNYEGGGTIGGGAANIIQPTTVYDGNNPYGSPSSFSTISGGYGNQIQGNSVYSAIGGGQQNIIQPGARNSFIGGGSGNLIQANSTNATIAGGSSNVIQGTVSKAFIGGGSGNVIGPNGFGGSGSSSAIGGGYFNAIYEYDSFIGGGAQNFIGPAADHSVIGGGYSNVVNGSLVFQVSDVIGGGQLNLVQTNSSYAVIPGGYGNVVGGSNSFAAGFLAQATNNGAFVWSDTSTTNSFNSTSNNQFLVRAAGGVGIGTNSPTAALEVAGSSQSNITLRVDGGGIAISGAGIGSGTAAFIQLTSATNIVTDYSVINNPLCNGDPNALLFVTHNWNPSYTNSLTYFNKNFGVYYTGSQWAIFTEDLSAMPTNIAFNVLIVKR